MAFDSSKALEADFGFVISGAAGVYSSAATPIYDAPIGSIYIDSNNGRRFKKIGTLNTDWVSVPDSAFILNASFKNFGSSKLNEQRFVSIDSQNLIYIEIEKKSLILLRQGNAFLDEQGYVLLNNSIEVKNGI